MMPVTTEPRPVPAGTRLLHIGPPKTGTTVLQAAMQSKRDVMREHGVVLVGNDQSGRQAVLAALLDAGFDESSDATLFRRWRRLLDEMEAAGDERACLSNESLAQLESEGVRRMVDALGGDRAHVVAVARRLDRLLPSHWQEWVRIGSTSLSFEQWLEIVLGDHRDSRHWQEFWLPNDLERLLERWVGATSPDRFTLIVADEGDELLLSRAFETLLDLPDGLLQPDDTHRKNVSASLARVEVVRRVNQLLEDRDWPPGVKAALRSRVAKRIRSAPPWPGEVPVPPLPPWAATRVSELNMQREQVVRSSGVRVVGDPTTLGAPAPDATVLDGHPDLVSTELAAVSVVTAIGGAVELLDQQRSTQPRGKGRSQDTPSDEQVLERIAARTLMLELRRRATRRLLRRHR
jgi:hypothetical protein